MGTKTWVTTAHSNDWNLADNWQEGAVPQRGDDVVIPSVGDYGPPYAPQFEAGKLTIEGGGLGGGPIAVNEKFDWTGGKLHAAIEIGNGCQARVDLGAPDMSLGASIINNGTLHISGPGTLGGGGGTTIENHGVAFVEDGVRWYHEWGGAPAFVNHNDLSIGLPGINPSPTADMVVDQATIEAAAGTITVNGTLEILGGTISLTGGILTGAGRIVIASGGALGVHAPSTTDAALTIHVEDGLVVAEPETPAPILTIEGLLEVGTEAVLRGEIHLGGRGRMRWPAAAEPAPRCRLEGLLVVENHIKVEDGAFLRIAGGGEIVVGGRLTFLGDATITAGGHGVSVVGVLDTVGDPRKTVTLEDVNIVCTDTFHARGNNNSWPLPTTHTRFGAIAITGPAIADAPASLGHNLHVVSGTLHLSDGTGRLRGDLDIGSEAVLAVAGGDTGSAVTCAGRLDLPGLGESAHTGAAAPQVVFESLELAGTSRLVAASFPQGTLAADAPVKVRHRLTADGAIEIPAAGIAAGGAPLNGLIVNCQDVIPGFRRLDHPSKEWMKAPAYTPSGVELTAEELVGVHGFHCIHFPDDVVDDEPIPGAPLDRGSWFMQELYESTQAAYCGFYLKCDFGHTSGDWMKQYGLLKAQGFGFLPIYWGNPSMYPASAAHVYTVTPQQADTDAHEATTKALAAKVRQGSIIYFDLENSAIEAAAGNVPPGAPPAPFNTHQLLAYLDEWSSKLGQIGTYSPGLYAPRAFCAAWVSAHPGFPVWPVHIGDINPIYDELSHPTGNIAMTHPAITNTHGTAWQWEMNQSRLEFLDSDGIRRRPRQGQHGYQLDYDTAMSVDPSLPQNTNLVKRYHSVNAIASIGGSTWAGGAREILVTLDRPAPKPRGTLVHLSYSDAAVQGPIKVRVPAEESEVRVTVDAHLVDAATAVVIAAWTSRQERSSAPAASITVTT